MPTRRRRLPLVLPGQQHTRGDPNAGLDHFDDDPPPGNVDGTWSQRPAEFPVSPDLYDELLGSGRSALPPHLELPELREEFAVYPARVTTRVQRGRRVPISRRRFSPTGKQSFMRLGFRSPKRVTLCQSRETRRSVLFAARVAGSFRRRSPGRGGSYNRRPSSYYSCR